MNNQEKIKRLEELIENENPAFHRWISKVKREIEKLKNEQVRKSNRQF